MEILNSEAKVVVKDSIEKLVKSLGTELAYKKELADDQMLLDTVRKLQESGGDLPVDCPYHTFDEWITQVTKEVEAGLARLKTLDKYKSEKIAFEYFVANATDEPKEQ